MQTRKKNTLISEKRKRNNAICSNKSLEQMQEGSSSASCLPSLKQKSCYKVNVKKANYPKVPLKENVEDITESNCKLKQNVKVPLKCLPNNRKLKQNVLHMQGIPDNKSQRNNLTRSDPPVELKATVAVNTRSCSKLLRADDMSKVNESVHNTRLHLNDISNSEMFLFPRNLRMRKMVNYEEISPTVSIASTPVGSVSEKLFKHVPVYLQSVEESGTNEPKDPFAFVCDTPEEYRTSKKTLGRQGKKKQTKKMTARPRKLKLDLAVVATKINEVANSKSKPIGKPKKVAIGNNTFKKNSSKKCIVNNNSSKENGLNSSPSSKYESRIKNIMQNMQQKIINRSLDKTKSHVEVKTSVNEKLRTSCIEKGLQHDEKEVIIANRIPQNDKENRIEERSVLDIQVSNQFDDLLSPGSFDYGVQNDQEEVIIANNTLRNNTETGIKEMSVLDIQELNNLDDIFSPDSDWDVSDNDENPLIVEGNLNKNRKQINIISNTVIVKGKEATNLTHDKNYYNTESNSTTNSNSPWRLCIPELRINPHWLLLKDTSLPLYNQEMVINAEYCIEKPARVETEICKPNKTPTKCKQTNIVQYFNDNRASNHNTVPQTNISLFDCDQLSPLKTEDDVKHKRPQRTSSVKRNITRSKSRKFIESTPLKTRSSNLPSSNANPITPEDSDDNSQLGLDGYFGFDDDDDGSNKENTGRVRNRRNKTRFVNVGVPTRISAQQIKRVFAKETQRDEDLSEEVHSENEQVELEVPDVFPSPEVENNDFCVGLFDDLETFRDRSPSLTYMKKKRTRRVRLPSVESQQSVDEEIPKQKRKFLRDKIEDREFNKWVAQFNSMCEEVEQHNLEID